jgi:sulfite reductase (ferredoxin)
MIKPADDKREQPAPRRHPERPSKAERQKEQSAFLRGAIAEGLADAASDRFDDTDLGVLKFHGIYQYYDRDARAQRKQSRADREYACMIRARVPGGVLTADQWLRLDALARLHGQGSLRLTTRQGLQYHGVLKGDLRTIIRSMNRALVTTLSACGDVARNVMCCPAVTGDPGRRAVHRAAQEIAAALVPRTRAYHEIWLDGERLRPDDPLLADGETEPGEFEVEPTYGRLYLPRKFKVGIALCDDNCIDVYTQDCGLVAAVDPVSRELLGYNVLAGGGLGMTHRKADTFARLGTLLGSIRPAQAVATVRAFVEIFRDYGNREDRRHARLKYAIEEFGVDWFIGELERRADLTLGPAFELPPLEHQDHLGFTGQGDGTFSYGMFLEHGRVRNDGPCRVLDAVRAIVDELRPGLRITPHQNLLFTDLPAARRHRVEEILGLFGVPTNDQVSVVRRHSMACPALPTCGLALADAERTLPGIVDRLEPLLEDLGLDREAISVRMTGCPNGCARPYTADIAFTGRGPGLYDVHVGGRLAGDRLVDLLAERVGEQDVVAVLRPVLAAWGRGRLPNEGFGDWWQRMTGRTEPRTLVTGAEAAVGITVDGEEPAAVGLSHIHPTP